MKFGILEAEAYPPTFDASGFLFLITSFRVGEFVCYPDYRASFHVWHLISFTFEFRLFGARNPHVFNCLLVLLLQTDKFSYSEGGRSVRPMSSIFCFPCIKKSLKGLFHPAFLARVVSWFPFVVAIFMAHENGGKQRLAKR